MTSTECEFYRVNRKMITVLGLRGDTLAVYALIASFSKDEIHKRLTGSEQPVS